VINSSFLKLPRYLSGVTKLLRHCCTTPVSLNYHGITTTIVLLNYHGIAKLPRYHRITTALLLCPGIPGSAVTDKVNFIKTYAKAREARITEKIICSRWRVTRNWLISRAKALRHPQIQVDKVEVIIKPVPYLGLGDTPKCSRYIRDLSKNKTPVTRQRYAVIAKGFKA
jgi:hypothetical protein